MNWLHRLFGRLPVRRWHDLPVQLHSHGLPDWIESIVIDAVTEINAVRKRPILQWAGALDEGDGAYVPTQGRILILPRADQTAAVRTTLSEHVERGAIEAAQVVIGAPILRTGDLTVTQLAACLRLALGASDERYLLRLYL